MRKAQGNLEKAQKKLQDISDPLQSNVRKTVEVVNTGTVKARQGLNQATTRAKEMQESWQEQSIQRQHKRKRSKDDFPLGNYLWCGTCPTLHPCGGT